MPSSADAPSETPDSWDDAPCGLLRIDADGLVLAANARVMARLGYTRGDLVGRMRWNDLLAVGSRVFFQTQLAPVLELDGALEEVMLDLRGSDGTRIPALVNAVRDEGGASVRIALMSVPDRRAYENELRRAREQAERAHAADMRARLRLELVAQANTALASSVDVEIALGRLARVLVPELADWCVIYTVEPGHPGAPAWSAAHTDHDGQQALERLIDLLPHHVALQSQFGTVVADGRPLLLSKSTLEQQLGAIGGAELLDLARAVGLASVVVAPSTARGVQAATMILARGESRSPFGEDDLIDLTDLGARTGLVIDNLRRQAREHSNSIALQQALLTSPPPIPGLEIATRYLPATAGNEVGGDWYDTFVQADGTAVFVIGDVVGHDIHAAAAMGQLRGVIRSVGYAIGGSPAAILRHVDATARGLAVEVLASAFVARLERSGTGATLRWSNAGHPPPLLVGGNGEVVLLDAPPDPILGVPLVSDRHEHVRELSAGDVLVFYTDGLVERVDEDIDVGISRLAAQVGEAHALPLDELCEVVLSKHHNRRRDDIALLVVRLCG